jgi:hypothetical protein
MLYAVPWVEICLENALRDSQHLRELDPPYSGLASFAPLVLTSLCSEGQKTGAIVPAPENAHKKN